VIKKNIGLSDMDVEIICRQTNYLEVEAAEKLRQFGSVENVIIDYLAIQPRLQVKKTTNQMIYGEIREIMKRPT
jgi:hypothetical protein